MSDARRVEVSFALGSYEVRIGSGARADLPALLADAAPSGRCVVIADEAVGALWGGELMELLDRHGIEAALEVVPPGEEHKTRESWARLTDALLAAGLARDGAVVAFGGGVISDLAGFVASTYMRGVPAIHLPTTLLAMIDASVGGKTGVDHPAGKNLIGTFHAPAGVLADVDFLRTLPQKTRALGLSEAVKHGAIRDSAYAAWLAENAEALLDAKTEETIHAVARSVEIKSAVVSRDEFERGEREILNFGHTLGHAYEAVSGFAVPHGEAVVRGMAGEAWIGERLGLCPAGTTEELKALISRFGLPTRPLAGADARALLDAMAYDKKSRAGSPRIVFLKRMGEALQAQTVPARDLEALLSELGRTSGGPGTPTRSVVHELLAPWADKGDMPFVSNEATALSYLQMDEDSRALAASFQSLGVGRGDRIALALPPCVEFAIAAFAASRIGAVIAPLNPASTLADLRYGLRHSNATCAVTVESGEGADLHQFFDEAFLDSLPELRCVVTVGEEELWYDERTHQWEDLLSSGRAKELDPPVGASPEDPFALLYTAGRGGKPRGALLSHAGLLYAASETNRAVGLREEDVIVATSRAVDVFTLGASLIGAALGGARLHFGPNPQAAAFSGISGAAIYHGAVPTLVRAGRALPEEGHPRGVRALVAHDAPVGDRRAADLESAFGAPLLVAYARTEASGVVSIATADDAEDRRRFTAGRPAQRTRLRIQDETDAHQPVESVGEIRIRGPGLMLGYHRQPKESAQVLDEDGYFRTGDIGMIDEEGFLHVLGRSANVVISGGVEVHASEVEARIAAHPAIASAAVVGVPHATVGEAVYACAVREEGGTATNEEIRRWCRQALPDFKVPDEVIFVDALPTSSAGVVRRPELIRRIVALVAPEGGRGRQEQNVRDTQL